MYNVIRKIVTGATFLLLTSLSAANEVDVVDITIESVGDQSYRVSATLLHEDAGWEHYANRWDVLSESGQLLGTRVLVHPHDDEQPFTRSLTLTIPAEVNIITIRANDLVHEDGGKTMQIDVPRS